MNGTTPLVFVAGPITGGDIHDNIRRAFGAGMMLLRAGISPVVPHGNTFWGCVKVTPFGADGYVPEPFPGGIPYDSWLKASLALVARCDAFLRLPGHSRGAKMEEAEARRLGLPIFTDVLAVLIWAKGESFAAFDPTGGIASIDASIEEAINGDHPR